MQSVKASAPSGHAVSQKQGSTDDVSQPGRNFRADRVIASRPARARSASSSALRDRLERCLTGEHLPSDITQTLARIHRMAP
jgi:hypothetical protein